MLVEKQLYSCATFIDAIHVLIATAAQCSCSCWLVGSVAHYCLIVTIELFFSLLIEKFRSFDVKYGFFFGSSFEKSMTFNCTILREKIFAKKQTRRIHLWVINRIWLFFMDHIILLLSIPFDECFVLAHLSRLSREILTKSHKQLSILRFFSHCFRRTRNAHIYIYSRSYIK